MSASSVLVTGAGGLLGSNLLHAWRDNYRVIGTSHTSSLRHAHSWRGDLSVASAPSDLVRFAEPALVVHTAAWTDVDACEENPIKAMELNAQATGRLAAAAKRVGAAFIYVSTEGVFDGERGSYRESDTPRPINQYAASKLAGEQEALAEHHGALVVRVGLEGWRPSGNPGFVQWLVNGLRKGERRTICTDWVHTVIFAQNLAGIFEELWKAGANGIYHAGAKVPSSNWEIAQATASEFALDPSLLEPIESDQLRLRAPRPKNVSLLSDRLRETIGESVWKLDRGLSGMHLQESSGQLATIRHLAGG